MITVTVAATVVPLPDYVRRITTSNVARGEVIGGVQVWPTARPAITLEAGERLKISLRIRARVPNAGSLKLATDAPDSWKLRRENGSGDYWVDIQIEPASASSSRTVALVLDVSDGHPSEIKLALTVDVPTDNLVVTPKSLDFGEVTLANAQQSLQRLGIRKIVGTFHIKTLSCSLPFLKLTQVTMVEGSNYLIRVTVDPTKPLRPGSYEGSVLIEPDAGARFEVPVKIKFTDH